MIVLSILNFVAVVCRKFALGDSSFIGTLVSFRAATDAMSCDGVNCAKNRAPLFIPQLVARDDIFIYDDLKIFERVIRI